MEQKKCRARFTSQSCVRPAAGTLGGAEIRGGCVHHRKPGSDELSNDGTSRLSRPIRPSTYKGVRVFAVPNAVSHKSQKAELEPVTNRGGKGHDRG